MVITANTATLLSFKVPKITTSTITIEFLDHNFSLINSKTANRIDEYIYTCSHAFLNPGTYYARFNTIKGFNAYTKYTVVAQEVPVTVPDSVLTASNIEAVSQAVNDKLVEKTEGTNNFIKTMQENLNFSEATANKAATATAKELEITFDKMDKKISSRSSSDQLQIVFNKLISVLTNKFK